MLNSPFAPDSPQKHLVVHMILRRRQRCQSVHENYLHAFFFHLIFVCNGVGIQTAVYVCLTSCRLGCKTVEDEDEA